VGLVETPVAPFKGEARIGADGVATFATVVKLNVDEYALVPLAFVALTCQK
jgi:hypothetical protein